MSDREKGLGLLGGSSLDIQLKWTMGLFSETIRVTKKSLKKAIWIDKQPNLEAEIIGKDGKPRKRIFKYGFDHFTIERKGKKRDILAPHPELQLIFKAIKNWLEKISTPQKNTFGFVKGRGAKKAVQKLQKEKHFFRFDIADAFPSILSEMIEMSLKKLKISEALVTPVVWLVTHYYNSERRLPQGSSTSPTILNLVYKPMCEEIDRVCKNYKIKWIVYADDFNFGAEDITQKTMQELLAIPAKFGFKIKPEKTKDNLGKTIPHILGLTVVDGDIHINRSQKNKFRRMMYAARKFDAYNPAQVSGIAAHITGIYGPEKNWPGNLSREYFKYLARHIPYALSSPEVFDECYKEYLDYQESKKGGKL